MLFGFDGVTRGWEREDERRGNARRENASLYNEFVRMNPGATVQERMDYANQLISASGAGSAGLPTRAQMESNYNKHRQDQARAAAARAQAEEERTRRRTLENMRIANELGPTLASLYGSPEFDESVDRYYDNLGIDESLRPLTTRAAEDAAWTQWRERNADLIREFNNNPTQANLDALTAAGGAIWGVGSTPPSSGASDAQGPLTGGPTAAPTAAPTGGRVAREFGGAVERRRAADLQAARVEIEALSGLSDLQDFDARADLIAQKYPEIAGEIGQSVSAVRSRVEEGISQTQRQNTVNFENQARSAAQQSQTREAFDASMSAIRAQADAAGLTVDFSPAEGVWASRQAGIDRQQSENAQLALSAAVDTSQDTVAQLIREGQSDEEIEAFIERNVANRNGGTAVEMTAEDRASLLRTISSGRGQLLASLDQVLRQDVTGENAARTLTQSHEDFIKNFETALRAEGVQNPEAYSHLAESYWQTAVTQVREAANEAEERKINETRTAMGDDVNDGQGLLRSQQYDAAKLREYAVEMFTDPAVIGTPPTERNVTDMTGTNKARIASQVVATVNDMAIALNIPITDDLARTVVNEITRMANTPNAEGTSYLNEDGVLPREFVEEAFYRAFELQQFNGLDPEVASIESRALADTLDAMGLNSIREVMGGDDIMAFQAVYSEAREAVRRSQFDVLRGVTVADDVAPAQAVATRVENDVMPAFEVAAEAITYIRGLNDIDMSATAISGQGDVYERLTALDEAANLNSTAVRAVEAELARLNALSQSAIYRRNNEEDLAIIQQQAQSLRAQMTVLTQQGNVIANAEADIASKIARGNAAQDEAARRSEEEARAAEYERDLAERQARADAASKRPGRGGVATPTDLEIQENREATSAFLEGLLPWNWNLTTDGPNVGSRDRPRPNQ